MEGGLSIVTGGVAGAASSLTGPGGGWTAAAASGAGPGKGKPGGSGALSSASGSNAGLTCLGEAGAAALVDSPVRGSTMRRSTPDSRGEGAGGDVVLPVGPGTTLRRSTPPGWPAAPVGSEGAPDGATRRWAVTGAGGAPAASGAGEDAGVAGGGVVGPGRPGSPGWPGDGGVPGASGTTFGAERATSLVTGRPGGALDGASTRGRSSVEPLAAGPGDGGKGGSV